MNILEIFLRGFWDTRWYIPTIIGYLIGLVIYLASNLGGTFIASTKSFPELLEIFLREFWDIRSLLSPLVIGLLIGVVIRLASNVGGTFIASTKSFPELAAYTKDDQQRFLREASKEAFSGLSFVPVLVVLAFLMVGFALANTVLKVTALPHWAAGVLSLPPLWVLGFRLGARSEAHRVRPFLKKLIDGQNGKSVA